MEVIDVQAVRNCLAEVSDCEDKQYAIALLEWAIGKRTFDLAKHDSELLNKTTEKLKAEMIEAYPKNINGVKAPTPFAHFSYGEMCNLLDKVITEMKEDESSD